VNLLLGRFTNGNHAIKGSLRKDALIGLSNIKWQFRHFSEAAFLLSWYPSFTIGFIHFLAAAERL